jgi:hypothetical protein
MQQPMWAGLALLAIVVVVGGGLAVGQGPPSAKQPSAKQPAAETPAEKPVPEESALNAKKQFRPRLPNYYGHVVSEKQRKEIYEIQREYFPKIEALKAELAALTAERDEKVAAVLSPEQLKQVEKFRAEAESKRKGGKAGKEKAGAETSNE